MKAKRITFGMLSLCLASLGLAVVFCDADRPNSAIGRRPARTVSETARQGIRQGTGQGTLSLTEKESVALGSARTVSETTRQGTGQGALSPTEKESVRNRFDVRTPGQAGQSGKEPVAAEQAAKAGGRFPNRPPARRPDDRDPHMTGLRPPTKEELAWDRQHAVRVRRVRLNSLGLKRINAARKKKGLRPLDTKTVEVVPIGSEVDGATESDGAADGGAPSGEALPGTLPAAVDNSTLKYFPPTDTQGSLPSCAQWAGVYYAGTYAYAWAHDIDAKNGDESTRFSPKWTYNMVNSGELNGSGYTTAYRIAQKHGLATWQEFPYQASATPPSNYREWCLNPAVWRNALNRRFDQYGYVPSTDTDPGIEAVKQMLNNGYVLNVPTFAYAWQWTQLEDDPATSADDALVGKNCVYWTNNTTGAHAVTVVGYNDDAWTDINNNDTVDPGEKGAFKIANSWGHTWNGDGFFWMAYDALKSPSAVAGGPSAGRQCGWYSKSAYWVTARVNYQPKMVAKFTINHLKRNQVRMSSGISDIGWTSPTTPWAPAYYFLYAGGGPYAFDGTITACDGTFYFDFTDVLPTEGVNTRWHVGMLDITAGDTGTIKDFNLYKVTPGGDQLVGTAANTPKEIPLSVQTFVWVDYTWYDNKVYYVDEDATGADTGLSWADAFTDLQDALAAAEADDEVWVAEGSYRPTSGSDRSVGLQLKSDVGVYGGFAGTETARTQRDWAANVTTLSGDIGVVDDNADNSYHVVRGVTGATLDGFVITGGNANGSGADSNGGGMHNSGASPTVANCIFSNNQATSYGGGMYNRNASPQLTNCLFVNNTATSYYGGAVYNNASSPSLTNCTLSGNTAVKGGAMANMDVSMPAIKNCIFWGNTAGTGNEFYNSSSTPAVSYSCVAGGYAGTDNISSDPLFVGGGDYHLKSRTGHWTSGGWVLDATNSPCVDAGDPASGCASEPDPNGGRINMGTYGGTARASKTAQNMVLYVDAGATGDNNGTSWTDAYTDLQDALTGSRVGDEIWVAEGAYRPTIGSDRTISFQPKSGAPVYGGFAGTESERSQRDPAANVTVLSGDIGTPGDSSDNSYHVLVGATGATLDGLTITGGNANGAGGWGNGAGMLNIGVEPVLVNCIISNNTAVRGGGMYNSACSPTLTDCTFSENNASIGGAIYNYTSSPVLTGCTLSENTSDTYGGAFYSRSSSPQLTNCLLVGNTATARYGGAFYNSISSPQLTNCTLSGNSAVKGGGMASFSSSSPVIRNCIFWGNSAGTGNEFYSSSSAPAVSYSCVAGGYAGTGNISSAPLFAGGGDYHLKSRSGRWTPGGYVTDASTSPSLDTGDPISACGNEPAPNGGRINLGVYGNTSQASKRGGLIHYVDADATGGNSGASWQDAFTELYSAFAVARDGDQVWVAEGTYKPGNQRISNFALISGVSVYGGFDGSESSLGERDPAAHSTVLSGDIGVGGSYADNCYHVVVGADNAVLDGFTITGGNADGAGSNSNGGGILNSGASPTLVDCIFRDNRAGVGGGMSNSGASPTVTRCVFSGNTAASYGGGMYDKSSSAPQLVNCVFADNTATSLYGGAVYNNASSPSLTNCTLSGNTASKGGAMANMSGSSPAIKNCIFWGNSAGTGNEFYNSSSTPAVSYSCVAGGYAGTGNVSANPQFVSTVDPDGPDGTFGTADDGLRCASGGGGEDAGTASGAPGEDLRGASRPQGSGVDMGAYEWFLADAMVFVDVGATGANDGTSWADAFTTVQAGLDAADNEDKEVWVAGGSYLISSSVTLKDGVAVYGGFAGSETERSGRDWLANTTTIDGQGATDHVLIGCDNATLDGFTVTGGAGGTVGGGMYNNGASPTVANCVFSGNTAASYGGGMYNKSSSPQLTNCLFVNNTATNYYGGAVYNNASSPSLTNCTLSGNTASKGGAMANMSGSSPAIKNCIFWGNSAGTGNEFYNSRSTLAVSYSCVAGGYAGTGNISSDPLFAGGGDYHLKSTEGRWTAGDWVADGVSSPCIDAGDPASAHAEEPAPNGSQANMGVYGNTAQASKSGAGAEASTDDESEDMADPVPPATSPAVEVF